MSADNLGESSKARTVFAFEDILGAVFYAYMAIIVAAEVVRRYVFNASSTWAEETAVYAFIWLAHFAAASAARDRAHLSFDILGRYLSPKANRAITLLSDIAFLALALLIVWTAGQNSLLHYQYDQQMRGVDLPIILASAAVPVGWGLVALRVCQRAIRLIRTPAGGLGT